MRPEGRGTLAGKAAPLRFDSGRGRWRSRAAMLVHAVRFWLLPDLSAERRAAFRAGLESLRAIPTVRQLHIGTPAPVPPRPVVETDYSYALTVLFDDVAGHDIYQAHPVHQAFVANHKADWTKVAVFDAM